MQKKFIIIIGLLILLINLNCDFGIFDMQAVCKIKLKNGDIINGFIVIGKGGYQKYYKTNGFCSVSKKYNSPALFSVDFESINLVKRKFYRTTHSSSFSKRDKLYYLKDITSTRLEVKEKRDSLNILHRDIIIRNKYKLLDYIPIYTILPEGLWLDRDNINQIVKVPIETVEYFELLKQPTEKIVSLIKNREKLFNIKHNTPPIDGNPRFPPVWFHNIVEDKSKENRFKKWSY